MLQLIRGAKSRPIEIQRLIHQRRGKMRGKGKGKTHRRCELCSVEAGAQNPDRDLEAGAGNRLNLLPRLDRLKVVHQLGNIVRKAVGRRRVPAEGPHGELVGAGSATQSEIDAPGKERGEGSELLGDNQWRVVRQHDPTGSNSDARCACSDMPDHHGRGGARDARHAMMLGQPEAAVTPELRVLRQIQRAAQCLRGVAALGNWRQIKH